MKGVWLTIRRYFTSAALYSLAALAITLFRYSVSFGVAVFGVTVVFVFSAVEHNAPNGADAECVVEISVAIGCVQRELFRHGTAQFMVATTVNNWYFAICDAACDFIISKNVVVVAQAFGNIAVEDEQIKIIAVVFHCVGRGFDAVMRVRQHDNFDVFGLFKRTEVVCLLLERLRPAEVFTAFCDDAAAERVGFRGVQFGLRDGDSADWRGGADDAVDGVVVRLAVDFA